MNVLCVLKKNVYVDRIQKISIKSGRLVVMFRYSGCSFMDDRKVLKPTLIVKLSFFLLFISVKY